MPRYYAASGAAAPTGLQPTSTIAVVRSGSNPTFNFNSLVENALLVAGTYYAPYTASGGIKLATASSIAGPWAAGTTVITATAPSWTLYAPHLMLDSGTFYIFYSVEPAGGTPGIYCATASVVTGPYTKYPSDASPAVQVAPGASGAWDDFNVSECSILKSGSTYYMAYMGDRSPEGSAERVGIASATTLTGTWSKSSANPIISVGAAGQWDDYGTADPFIFYVNGRWWIWYTGLPGPTSTSQPWAAGFAYASDPVAGPWTKFTGNPVITGSGSGFDQQGAFRGSIYIDGSTYHLLYTGIPSGTVDLATMKGGNATLTIT